MREVRKAEPPECISTPAGKGPFCRKCSRIREAVMLERMSSEKRKGPRTGLDPVCRGPSIDAQSAIMGRSCSMVLAPMPRTFTRSSTDLKGPFSLR